jgi:hypothetical protein
MVKLGEAGLPDIIVIVPSNGRVLGLEVKSQKGKQRPAQREFQSKLETVGGSYRLVRNLEQAMAAVAEALGKEQWEAVNEVFPTFF